MNTSGEVFVWGRDEGDSSNTTSDGFLSISEGWICRAGPILFIQFHLIDVYVVTQPQATSQHSGTTSLKLHVHSCLIQFLWKSDEWLLKDSNKRVESRAVFCVFVGGKANGTTTTVWLLIRLFRTNSGETSQHALGGVFCWHCREVLFLSGKKSIPRPIHTII